MAQQDVFSYRRSVSKYWVSSNSPKLSSVACNLI